MTFGLRDNLILNSIAANFGDVRVKVDVEGKASCHCYCSLGLGRDLGELEFDIRVLGEHVHLIMRGEVAQGGQ